MLKNCYFIYLTINLRKYVNCSEQQLNMSPSCYVNKCLDVCPDIWKEAKVIRCLSTKDPPLLVQTVIP